jgi:hypothetical protein
LRFDTVPDVETIVATFPLEALIVVTVPETELKVVR